MTSIWYLTTLILLNASELVRSAGPQWGFITNAAQAESMCLDGTTFGEDLERFRSECEVTSRMDEYDQLENEWTNECSPLEMLFDGCNSEQAIDDDELEKERMSQCIASNGQACVFPFTYANQEFDACTTYAASRHWCLTNQNIGTFGYCDDASNEACGIPAAPAPPPPSGGGSGGSLPSPVQKADQEGICMTSYPGQLSCDFPYVYKGVTFDGCTGKDSVKMWCSYKNDTTGNVKWWNWCEGDCFMVSDTNVPMQFGKGMPKALLSTTAAPSTAAPSTAAPSTAAPTPAVPTPAAPSTAAPSTAAPSTAAPSTAAPSTAAPTCPPSPTCPPTPTCPSAAAKATVPVINSMCVLRKFNWISGTGKKLTFVPNKVIAYVNKNVERPNIKKALLGILKKCRKITPAKTFRLMGPNGGFSQSHRLGCFETAFSQWCVKYIQTFTSNMAKVKA